jgi:hypothetical protein
MTTLICERCGIEWGVDYFPEVTDSLICEYCLAGEDASKARVKLVAKAKDIANKLLDATEVESQSPLTDTVCAEIYREFGGARGYAVYFKSIIDELMSRQQVPASAGTLMLNFLKIHLNVEAKKDQNLLRDMTDDQIRREQDLAMMQLIMESAGDSDRMELLKQAMKRQGLRIEQIDPSEQLAEAVRKANEL